MSKPVFSSVKFNVNGEERDLKIEIRQLGDQQYYRFVSTKFQFEFSPSIAKAWREVTKIEGGLDSLVDYKEEENPPELQGFLINLASVISTMQPGDIVKVTHTGTTLRSTLERSEPISEMPASFMPRFDRDE